MMDIIRDNKTGLYGFIWRITLNDGLYELQRYSTEYKTWLTVQSRENSEELVELYNNLEI